MRSSLLQYRFLGIQLQEYLLVLGFYFFIAYSYALSIWINSFSQNYQPPLSDLYTPAVFLEYSGLHYIVMLLLTIIIWWLIFRKFGHWPLKYRLLIHVVTGPFFVIVGQRIYYQISDWLDWGHLSGSSSIWDIFIPALFYLLQFGVFHAYEHYHNNQRNLKLKAQLTEAALKSELSALKAQLNPHFLYNTFNTISASLPPEQEQTREMIATLSDLFRYQLKASRSDLVPLQEEIDFIKKYLSLEKARFEERLQVRIDIPQILENALIPPMILQPLVENSVKHGISSLIEGGEVYIKAEKKGEKIHFEVSDTGTGVQDKSVLFKEGVGLTNTKLRLEKQYDSEMVISDNQPRGLKIQFAI